MKLIFKRFNLPVNQMRGNQDGQYIQWNNWDFVFGTIYEPIITHSRKILLEGYFQLPNDNWKEYAFGFDNKLYAETTEILEPTIWFKKENMTNETYRELMPFIEKNFSPSQGKIELTGNRKEFLYDPLFSKLVSRSSRDRFYTNLICQVPLSQLSIVKKVLIEVSYASGDFSSRDRAWVTSDKALIKMARNGIKEDLLTITLFFGDHFIVLLYGDNISDEINKIGNLVDSASDEYKNKLGDLFLGKNI